MRSQALTALLLTALAAPAMAQSTVRLSGWVAERGANAGLAGANVELGGRRVTTDIEGRFTLNGVSTGHHMLNVTAFGYSDRQVPIMVQRDTSIVIELDPAPIPLDPLLAEGRTVTVRGKVSERGDGLGLIDVEVFIGSQRADVTNAHGRFRIDDVPAGPPLRLSIFAFGYMPIESIVSLFDDTTLVVQLEPDPLIQQMIQEQVERLEERARPFRTAVMPTIDRDYLVRHRDGTVYDLLRRRYGPHLGRVKCLLIDDRQRSIDDRLEHAQLREPTDLQPSSPLEGLTHYYPDQLERIEVLERGRMLRIYTRNYIRRMIGGGVELPKPAFVPRKPPFCR